MTVWRLSSYVKPFFPISSVLVFRFCASFFYIMVFHLFSQENREYVCNCLRVARYEINEPCVTCMMHAVHVWADIDLETIEFMVNII